MSGGMCDYCSGPAEQNLADMWLCQRHQAEIEDKAGGITLLLELSPQARRALADAVLPRLVLEDVQEPSDVFEP